MLRATDEVCALQNVKEKTLKIQDLNPSLLCTLCSGYLIDATTIIECLHSFCRSCIVKYLQTHKYCPICEVQVHKNKPLLNIRSDEVLQDIVYKLVPGLFQNEMRRRYEFYSCNNISQNVDNSSTMEVDEGPVCLSLEYDDGVGKKSILNCAQQRRFLRCPRAVRIHHLHKLLRSKYALDEKHHRVDVMCAGRKLNTEMTIGEMANIFLWRTKSPLHLTYKIFTAIANTQNNASMQSSETFKEVVEKSITQHIKSNETQDDWKEVQLQISENGVMSVTGINNEDNQEQPSAQRQSSTTPIEADLLNNNQIEKIVEDKTSPVEEETSRKDTDTTKKCESQEDGPTEAKRPKNDTPQIENGTKEKVEPDSSSKEKEENLAPKNEVTKSTSGPDPELSSQSFFQNLNLVSQKDNAASKSTLNSKSEEKTSQGSQKSASKDSKSKTESVEKSVSKSGPVENLSSGHPLKIHSQSKTQQTPKTQSASQNLSPSGIQYSRVGIVPKKITPNYKTLRDPPKAWNPQLPPQIAKTNDQKSEQKPAKFFKARNNNMPRFLGNPASGVKPLYNVPPENERPSTPRPLITKIDPKTLKPITIPNNSSQLKINQSTVPIFKKNVGHTNNGSRRKDSPPSSMLSRPQLSFTPTNPFIPNLAPSHHPFLYPHMPPPSTPPLLPPHPMFYPPQRYKGLSPVRHMGSVVAETTSNASDKSKARDGDGNKRKMAT